MSKRWISATLSSYLLLAVGCAGGDGDSGSSGAMGNSTGNASTGVGTSAATSTDTSNGTTTQTDGSTTTSSGTGTTDTSGGTASTTGTTSTGTGTTSTGTTDTGNTTTGTTTDGTTAMGGAGTTATATGGAGADTTAAGGTATAAGGDGAGGAASSMGGSAASTGGTTAMGGSGEPAGGSTSVATTGDCRVWMATNGDDGADGSEGSPVASLQVAYDLVCPKPASGTENGAVCGGPAPRSICVRPGTYQLTERLEFKKTRMGEENNRVILMGDPNSSEKPVLDFSGQERLSCGANPDNIGGLTINAWYVTVKNLEIMGANDNCVLMQGYEGLVENVLVHDCADTGIQISSGGEYDNSGLNNTVLNCDSHNNYDVQCDGENADGFAVKEGTGAGNAFIGCRSWDNVDDGWDLYGWTSPVRIENSWSFAQCETNQTGDSDCNGFKLGGGDPAPSATHNLVDLIAVGNGADGFTNNNNPASLSCSGTCAAWGNDGDQTSVSGVSTSAVGGANVTNMRADSARNADGSLKDISAL